MNKFFYSTYIVLLLGNGLPYSQNQSILNASKSSSQRFLGLPSLRILRWFKNISKTSLRMNLCSVGGRYTTNSAQIYMLYRKTNSIVPVLVDIISFVSLINLVVHIPQSRLPTATCASASEIQIVRILDYTRVSTNFLVF